MRDIFQHYYETNFWKDKESVSGQGSNLMQTEHIRELLPKFFVYKNICSILDIPCGDFYWFEKMLPDMILHQYIGADIVPDLLIPLVERYKHRPHMPFIDFMVLDATKDKLPKVDLIFCRDMLGHFSNKEVMRALDNFKKSGSKYLMATTFPGANPNTDIETGQWRKIDLSALRYGLGPAEMVLNEKCTEGKGKFIDKSLGLWVL